MAARIGYLYESIPGVFDITDQLRAPMKKNLLKTWAVAFREDVLPNLSVERFECLYSNNNATRPSTPIRLVVGALIIQQYLGLTDDEMVEAMQFDMRVIYALGTGSFEKPPISDKTLTRFRNRCLEHYDATGVDLLHDCIIDMANSLAGKMGISGLTRRMDSMMIASTAARLSRLALCYRCLAGAVIRMNKVNQQRGEGSIPEQLTHFLVPGDYNKVTYRRKDDAEGEMKKLLAEADLILETWKAGNYEDCQQYTNLVRFLSEQTIVEKGVRRLRTKKDGGMHSGMLQNPSDPEATFREKAGKPHHGFAMNFEGAVGKNASVITDYDVETNNVSDISMLERRLEGMERQEKPTTLTADGAYFSESMVRLAARKNIRLITTDITGTPTQDIRGDFEFNSEGTEVTSCPGGHKPLSCSFSEKSGSCTITIAAEHCAQCPYADQCPRRVYKSGEKVSISVSVKQQVRARQQRFMTTEEYKGYARIRNGAETVPSIIRRNYNLRGLPRNLRRIRFRMGAIVGAVNFQKLVTYRTGRGRYAQNELIS